MSKVLTLNFDEKDVEFLHKQKEKGLAMSFVIRKALELYRKKIDDHAK